MLPQPNDGFAWVQAPGGPALVCRPLEPIATHFFTTREWRLGSTAAGQRDDAWADVAAAAGVAADKLARLHQVHGSHVIVVRNASARVDTAADLPDADILVSDAGSSAVAVQAADCVPLLIGDRRTGVVAAAHAGWRGLAAGVPGAAVDALAREFGSRPDDLVAAIGPSIGACCYEVGEEVRDAFARNGFGGRFLRWFVDNPQPTQANPSMPSLSSARRPHHWFFDGWSAAAAQLIDSGITADRIHVARLCTASHVSLCSFRRDGAAAGRLAGVIRPRSG